jgi:hypothetical protein
VNDEIDNLVSKLREIEEQASFAGLEVPSQGLTSARLRQIVILAKFVRLRLQGQNVAMESLTPNDTLKPGTPKQ